MHAQQLLDVLTRAGCAPFVDGHFLRLRSAPPKEVARYVKPLQTGIRAILTRRHWYYTAVAVKPGGGMHRAGGELDPARLLPATAHLLYVEGDPDWDRIPPNWHDELSELYAATTARKGAA